MAAGEAPIKQAMAWIDDTDFRVGHLAERGRP